MTYTEPDWYKLFDTIAVPIQVYHLDGKLATMNQISEQIYGAPRDVAAEFFNVLTDPQMIDQGVPDLFNQALQGTAVATPPHCIASTQVENIDLARIEDKTTWVESIFFPLYNGDGNITHIICVDRDITERMSQRETILALSSPVVQVWEGILSLSLIGAIDSQRATKITENLLEAIVRQQADSVILDITGVATVDTQVAHYLLSAVRACRLLGSEVVLVGISSELAQTIVHLGIDLSTIVTRASFQQGLEWALKRQQLVVCKLKQKQPS